MNEFGVCTIGTSDPWNASGLGLDLRTLAELGVRAFSVVAGVSAQDAGGLRSARAIEPELIEAQFESLAAAPIAAYRIGALLDAASVAAVARSIAGRGVPVVYDPVIGPSGGGRFIGNAMRDAVRERLLPRVTIVTPNVIEAAYLCGADIDSIASLCAAANALLAFGCTAALVKGFIDGERVIDALATNEGVRELDTPRIAGPMRGTGCLLAAALAARLARGDSLEASVGFARAFVARKLAAARTVGGMRLAP